jgi:NAD(P)-dependent dehydrogenase (short-subunit alcohol dehydrogenase family)
MSKKMKNQQSKVWFITGASRGLGRAFTEAALEQGDRVMALARDVSPLAELNARYGDQLFAYTADITDKQIVFDSVEKCMDIFEGIDVLVNNAGQALFGMLEETTERQAHDHFAINFFGALWVVQAVIPIMRQQGTGHILQVSSMGSSGGFASVGMYSAGKAALDAMSEALAMEVEDFGIKVTIIQPGGYATELFTRGITLTSEMSEYGTLREKLAKLWGQSYDAPVEKAANIVMKIVQLEKPPKRIILGGLAYDQVMQMDQARTEEYQKWEALSREAD